MTADPTLLFLQSIGVTANYRGSQYAAFAVSLCAEHSEKLLLVTKYLYPEVAKRFCTTSCCVERGIRTIVEKLWDENRPALQALAGTPLRKRPTNSEFLAMLTFGMGETQGLSTDSSGNLIAMPPFRRTAREM